MKGLLLILPLLLVYNLLIVPPLGFHLHEGKKASLEENFTTASDSPISQKRHSEDENKAGSTQNNSSVTKNKAVDELGSSAKETNNSSLTKNKLGISAKETNNSSLTKNNLGSSARETNNLRLQRLTRACEEVTKKMHSRHPNREQLGKKVRAEVVSFDWNIPFSVPKRNKQTEPLIKDDFKAKEALEACLVLVLKKWELLKRDTFFDTLSS